MVAIARVTTNIRELMMIFARARLIGKRIIVAVLYISKIKRKKKMNNGRFFKMEDR